MRLTLAAALLAAATTVSAFAQGTAPTTGNAVGNATGLNTPNSPVNTTPDATTTAPSAVQTKNTAHRTSAAPVPGRNSFTMNEAAARITKAGYTAVTGLKKDNRGIWRGQATKDGSPVAVSLDYQGTVTGQ